MENIIISNPKDFERKKQAIINAGKENLHIVSDFDRTLTKAFVNSKATPSLIAEFYNSDNLSKEFSEKAKELAEKYYPIEINPAIPIKEKKQKMIEWWTKVFDLFIQHKLNKKHLEKVVNKGNIMLREGAEELLKTINNKNIPLLILSSSGIGEIIPLYLKKHKLLLPNIHIISNFFKWDSNGNAIEVKKPIIHVLNKGETAIKQYPIFNLIKNRKNIILLGDSLGDIDMANGISHETIIKIGFLNYHIKENLELFKQNFDIVILNDSSMDFVNDLLKNIL